MKIKEAAERWVREMDAIPTEMIRKLMQMSPDDWLEATIPVLGDRVYYYGDAAEHGEGDITKVDSRDAMTNYYVELDSGEGIWTYFDIEVEYGDELPMWSVMWSMNDIMDQEWLEKEGVVCLSECGFRVFHNEEFGYFFGIDGAGYDFYESHWIPLYKSRGLHWHSEE